MSAVLEQGNRLFGDEEDGDIVVPPTTFARDTVEWMEFSETGLTYEELGKPTLWRVTIFPKQPKKMSKGGIALPSLVQNVEAHMNYIGQVVALGPLAGKSEKFENPEWVLKNSGKHPDPEIWDRDVPRYLWDIKVGDWVIYGRFSGQKTEYKGVLLLTCNDDDIMEKIDSPEHFKVYL